MRVPGDSVVATAIGGFVAALVVAGAASAGSEQGKNGDGAGRTPLTKEMSEQWKSQQPAEFGFSDSGPGFLKAADEAANAGSTIARFAVSWTNITENGFGNLDDVVEVLRENGIQPMLTVSDAPPSTNPDAFVDGQFYIKPPLTRYSNQFADFYTLLAARYPDAILQVWSEPNLEFYGKIPPDRYVDLANRAARAVHAVNPDQTVIGAAPSPGDGAWRQYLRAIYASLDPSIDLAVNLYPRKGRSIDLAVRRLSKDFKRVKKIARGRPIWVTETGLAAIQFGVKRQAKGSARIYKVLAGGGAEGILFHRLIDPDAPINEWEDSLGALRVDQQPMPLYNRLRALRLRHLRLG